MIQKRSQSTRALETRLEAAGFRLHGGELTIRHFGPNVQYPVPQSVRLVSEPLLGPNSKPAVRVDRSHDPCTSSCACCDRDITDDLTFAKIAADAIPRLEWDRVWMPLLSASDVEPRQSRQAGLRPLPGWQPSFSPPVDGCLRAFMRLADGSPEDILAFASRWGVLGICADGVPSSHEVRCQPLGIYEGRLTWGAGWEPLSFWYRYAREARGILNAALRLRNHERVANEDWRDIAGPLSEADFEFFFGSLLRDPPEMQQSSLLTYASHWFQLAGLRPRLYWDDGARAPHTFLAGGDLEFTGVGAPAGFLFAVLAVQLGAALTSPLGLYRCDECGYPYPPQRRRPQSGRGHYCPTCQGDGQLASKRNSYHRNKGRWGNRAPNAREEQSHGQ